MEKRKDRSHSRPPFRAFPLDAAGSTIDSVTGPDWMCRLAVAPVDPLSAGRKQPTKEGLLKSVACRELDTPGYRVDGVIAVDHLCRAFAVSMREVPVGARPDTVEIDDRDRRSCPSRR